MRRTSCAFVLCCVLSAAAPAAAQAPDPVVLKDIHRLLELTGGLKLGHQMATMVSSQVMETLSAGRGRMPPRAAQLINEAVEEEFRTAFAPGGSMADGIARVYARHFTADEIRGLIAFYETPLGRKVSETLPAIAQDSMQVGIEWAKRELPGVQRRIEEKLRAEGFIK